MVNGDLPDFCSSFNFGNKKTHFICTLSTFITFSCTAFHSNLFSHHLNFVVSFPFRDKDSIDWFSLVLFIIITQVVYIMARVYRYCFLTSKQCLCGLVYPRDGSDFLGRIGYSLWSSVYLKVCYNFFLHNIQLIIFYLHKLIFFNS